jgi:hypothetical protein
VSKVKSPLGVEILEMEPPVGRVGAPQKVDIERMKHNSLLFMVM